MKEQHFSWMLQGFHTLSELAVAYFPNYQHSSSAVSAMRRAIKSHALLEQELFASGFTYRSHQLTPQQISIIIHFWGMPDEAEEMIERNPYLATPKIIEKI